MRALSNPSHVVDDHELQRIIRQIIGPVPTLYLPKVPGGLKQRAGTRFIVAPSRGDLGEGSASAQETWELLQKLPMPNGLAALSAINLVLARAPYQDPLHAALARSFVGGSRLSEIRSLFRGDSPGPDAIQVFNRRGVLLLERLALAAAPSSASLDGEPIQILGELALIANDYLTGNQLRDAIAGGDVDYVPFLVDFIGTWDIANPPDLAYGLARAYRMLRVHLSGNDETVRKIRSELPIDIETVTLDGVQIDDYIASVFGIYSWLTGQDLSKLISGETSCVIELAGFLGATKLSPGAFNAFVSANSHTLEEFREGLSAGRLDTPRALELRLKTDTFVSETVHFRTHPLCRISIDKLVCLDSHFLAELVISGLYWKLIGQLNRHGREYGDRFAELWGHVLQIHVGELLQDCYPTSLSPMRTNVVYPGGEVDVLLDLGDDVILFEIKGSLLKGAAKYNRDRKAFEQDFALKFVENERGEPKALRQLAAAVAAARDRQLGLAGEPLRIFPVLVGYEICLDSFWVNRYSDDLFRKLLRLGIGCRPLTVMSVETLEVVLPYISAGDITWRALLERRFFGPDDKVVDYSVYQALYDWRAQAGIVHRRNDVLLQAFSSVFEIVMSRFKGHRDGAPNPPDMGT
jgi:hypothetical protein